MRDGAILKPLPTLNELRERFSREFARLPDQHKKLTSPEMYEVIISDGLNRLTSEVTRGLRERELGANPHVTN